MLVIVAAVVAAVTSAVVVRVLRSPLAGGSGRASAARRRPTVTTGGLAVLAALVPVAFLAAPLDAAAPRLVALAVGCGAVGGLVDRRSLPRWAGPVVGIIGGVGLVALRVRSEVLGVAWLDAAVTVGFVVALYGSVRLLDGSRGLAPAVTAPMAVGVAAGAWAAGDGQLVVVAAGQAAALAGVVLASPRPPRVRLGRSGSAAVGVSAAGSLVLVQPVGDPVADLGLRLLLVVVPVGLAAVVAVGRLRHGRRVGERADDGVLERLRVRGLRSGRALGVVAGTQALVAVAVGLAAFDVMPGIAVAVGVGAAVVLVAVAASATVHDAAATRPAVGRLLVAGGAAVVVVLVGPALVGMALAVGPARDGADAVQQGLDAARDADTGAARARFEAAAASFGEARGHLGLPLADLARAVPVLGPNLVGTRLVTELGSEVAEAGLDVAEAAPAELVVSGGRLPVDDIRRAAPPLARAAATLERSEVRLAGAERRWLLGPVREAVAELDRRLAANAGEATRAARVAELAPALFGGDGERRYFVAMENNAELRATGGFMGNYGELVVDEGRIRLERIGRVQELNEMGAAVRDLGAGDEFAARYGRFDVDRTWQSINLSPDFPTVGDIIARAYPQSGGRPVHGVIAIDPVGLAALLELAGPIEVPGWPEAIGADNVVDVTLNRAYEELELERRVDFLGEVAERVTTAVTERDLGGPTRIAEVLGDAVERRHLKVFLVDEAEQRLAADLGLDGAVEPLASDGLLVVNQNASANKVDYYLRRHLDYAVTLHPAEGAARVEGTLGLRLENTTPTEGVEPYIAGSLGDLEPGDNRTYLSVYTPLGTTGVQRDSEPVPVESERELGRSVYSRFLDIPASSSASLGFELVGEVPLVDGWYELRLDRQPVLAPDEVTVAVEVAPSWRIAEVDGPLALDGERRAVASFEQDRPEVLRVRLEPSAGG